MAQKECNKCKSTFTPKRKDMMYCSRACARNATRSERTFEYKRRNETHYERANILLEYFTNSPSQEHPKVAANLLKRALNGDATVKNILTDPRLLEATDGRRNVARRVNELCREGAKKSSVHILRTKDLCAIAKIECMAWHPDQCPKERPLNWDYRNLLPLHLQKESLQTSSAYIIRPEEHAESDMTKGENLKIYSRYAIRHDENAERTPSTCITDNETITALNTDDVDNQISILEVLAA